MPNTRPNLTRFQRLCGCRGGGESNRHGCFDLNKPSHAIALAFWHRWDWLRDLPFRVRFDIACVLRRWAARVRGEKYHDLGYSVMGNEAEAVAQSLRFEVATLEISEETRAEIEDSIDRLAEIAGANWYHQTKRERAEADLRR